VRYMYFTSAMSLSKNRGGSFCTIGSCTHLSYPEPNLPTCKNSHKVHQSIDDRRGRIKIIWGVVIYLLMFKDQYCAMHALPGTQAVFPSPRHIGLCCSGWWTLLHAPCHCSHTDIATFSYHLWSSRWLRAQRWLKM
jgi:hypothetical protein